MTKVDVAEESKKYFAKIATMVKTEIAAMVITEASKVSTKIQLNLNHKDIYSAISTVFIKLPNKF